VRFSIGLCFRHHAGAAVLDFDSWLSLALKNQPSGFDPKAGTSSDRRGTWRRPATSAPADPISGPQWKRSATIATTSRSTCQHSRAVT